MPFGGGWSHPERGGSASRAGARDAGRWSPGTAEQALCADRDALSTWPRHSQSPLWTWWV